MKPTHEPQERGVYPGVDQAAANSCPPLPQASRLPPGKWFIKPELLLHLGSSELFCHF